uniref:Williams-Beuren syndrome chromosomal region 27 n=1 Tax=Hemiscolopendra marginata TaxID=943146 RepID=A0A646QCE8_9MYRI
MREEYNANLKCHRQGISHEEMVSNYNSWAAKYDWDLRPGIYNGPEIITKFMAEYYFSDIRETLKIIDVAAGTGRVGEELKKYGFKNVDALEPSDKMLEIAKLKKTYKNYHIESLSSHKTKINDDSYDCLISSGGMGEGHIPTAALQEMIRIVRPGGSLFIVMREEYLKEVKEYNGKLEPFMEELTEKQLWRRKSRIVVPNYSFQKNGVVFIYEIL